jgi:hypothetical protein
LSAQFSTPISLRAQKTSPPFTRASRNSIRFADLVLPNFCQAEADTDEVYAQVMLMPEPEVSTTTTTTPNFFIFSGDFLRLEVLISSLYDFF